MLKMRYFILEPGAKDKAHAGASRQAMRAYADWIEQHNPKMAEDVRNWVKLESRKNIVKQGSKNYLKRMKKDVQ